MTWLKTRGQAVVLQLQIQPNAKKTEIVGLYGEPPRLKVRVHAPPVDGKANEEIERYFAELLSVAKSSVSIAKGEGSRQKELLVAGVSPDRVLAIIQVRLT